LNIDLEKLTTNLKPNRMTQNMVTLI